MEKLLQDLKELHECMSYVQEYICENGYSISLRDAWDSSLSGQYPSPARRDVVEHCRPQLNRIDVLLKSIPEKHELICQVVRDYGQVVDWFNSNMSEEAIHQLGVTVVQTEFCSRKV